MASDSTTFEEDCEFCRIARQTSDAMPEIIAREAEWLAFSPIEPATPGHLLVVPNAHFTDLWKIDPRLGAVLTSAAIDVGRVVQSALEPDGMNLITSAGAAAEQTVSHLHLHLVPRWEGDGFGSIWPENSRQTSEETLAAIDRIRAAYRSD